MKKSFFAITIASLIISCNPQTTKQDFKDTRPASQIYFMKKMGVISTNYNLSSNSTLFDKTVDTLNKLAIDSLKDVKNWEFIVEEINDNEHYSRAIALNIFQGQDVYNLILRSPINPKTEYKDSVSVSDNVHFMITLPKKPKTLDFKQRVEEIKSLNLGDTVLISGSITKLNENLKIDFTDIVKEMYMSYVDIFPKSITLKNIQIKNQ